MTQRFTADDVRLMAWCRGPLFVASTTAVAANKVAVEPHFLVEWNDYIDATMATIHPEAPWQRIPAPGADVSGYDAVRDYYLGWFADWPGLVMERFNRVLSNNHVLFFEGVLKAQPSLRIYALAGPCAIVIDFCDGLVLGKTVFGTLER